MSKRLAKHLLSRMGYAVTKKMPHSSTTLAPQYHPDMEPGFRQICERCRPYTMTTVARMYALFNAVRYLEAREIAGDIVECGVWRGGSSMVSALTLLHCGSSTRRLFLFDTFEGMSTTTDRDKKHDDLDVKAKWHASQKGDINEWCYAGLEDVKLRNPASTTYPQKYLEFVKGKVEQTIPSVLPPRIALLRLDTDFYESTRHELTHLYPRLVDGGVLILDDYGAWQGAREAVDEYFKQMDVRLLLHKIDNTGRIAIKT